MEQNKIKMRQFTPEEIAHMKAWKSERERNLQEDPEYRAHWEKMQADLKRLFPIDTIDDE